MNKPALPHNVARKSLRGNLYKSQQERLQGSLLRGLFCAVMTWAFLACPLPGAPDAARQAWGAPDVPNPGYRSLVTRLPSSRIRLDIAVWYPTQRPVSTIKNGNWTFQAARNAPPLPGPWPLIILSHDSAGSRFSHYDLAINLASRGYIVAAPTHDGDNTDDMRLLFSDLQLPTRAYQLRATLDMVLKDPQLGPLVNRSHIGLVGFGRGGAAGLLLAGATLTPDLWENYCAGQTGDQPSPYCAPFMAGKMSDLVRGMRDRAERTLEAGAMRAKAEEARTAALHRVRDGIFKAYARVQRSQKKGTVDFPAPPSFLPLLPPLRTQNELEDSRFRAMVLISPGYSMLFDPASLRQVKIPVLLVGIDGDPLDKPEQQAMRFQVMLPAADYAEFTGTDLPALQALCPPETEKDLPDQCLTVTPEERSTIHDHLENTLLDFFRRIWN